MHPRTGGKGYVLRGSDRPQVGEPKRETRKRKLFYPGCLEAPKDGDQGYPGVPKGPKWEKLIIKREAFLVPSASRQPKTGNRKLFVLGASRHPRTGIRNTCDAR